MDSMADTQRGLLNTMFALKIFFNRADQNQYYMVIKFINSKKILECLPLLII